jgi:hypothetical protein
MITQDQVKDLFEYRDGDLYWKVQPAYRIKIGSKAGTISSNGYWQTSIKHKKYSNHRLIFLMFYGYLPVEIDHIDNNPLNNRIENLREATRFENNYNIRKRADNTSGVKGVSWDKVRQKWRVQLCVEGKKKSFGYYHNIKVAKFIAETMRYKYHGAFARYGEVE